MSPGETGQKRGKDSHPTSTVCLRERMTDVMEAGLIDATSGVHSTEEDWLLLKTTPTLRRMDGATTNKNLTL